ncbi:MAG: FtsH protease activity modulator HflK [Rhodospirillales bacterium]|nr:FtsH protease activity modulator HflK [Rhodospirillales bacterium]
MAWNPQGGGQGPWGRGPIGPQPPDIEDLIRRGQENFRRMLPKGLGTGRGISLAAVAIVAVWLASGFYRVEPAERGVELLFGKFWDDATPGLNWFFPAPIGQVLTPNVEQINRVELGFRGAAEPTRFGGHGKRDVVEESLMLTADQNISDIDFVVQWKIRNALEYLFNIRDPDASVKVLAESAMREVIGQTTLQQALTEGRLQVEQRTKALLQRILDEYGAGVEITEVKLQKVDPPNPVIDAFNEVQRARQDKERKQNEAEAYRNRVVPQARGEAAKAIQEATAYKEQVVKEAEGEASRFLAVLEGYKTNPEVNAQRLYIEAMEEVLKSTNKVIIDGQSGNGVQPYLPLPELRRRAPEKPRP